MEIIIKPAGKGEAIVILNKEGYIKEGLRQLSVQKHYKPLFINPTEQYQR